MNQPWLGLMRIGLAIGMSVVRRQPVSADHATAVRLPWMPHLFSYADRLSRIRFDCRTDRHIASTEPLDALCDTCAPRYRAVICELRDALTEGLSDGT